VTLVIGAGDATGAAVGRRFAREGHTVCLVRRDADKVAELCVTINAEGLAGKAFGFGVDARVEEAVEALVEEVEAKHGPVEVCVHNIGANVKFSLANTTPRVYRKVWEMAALSAFLCGRAVGTRMAARQRGTVIFTGATASVRGGSGFTAFSGAMFAKRSLAQSMARELGPEGVHVAHCVVDGAIDTPWVRRNFPAMASQAAEVGGLLDPGAVAEQYLMLSRQPRTAWTHELDLRPYVEKW
jgi:NAD(P)-dependent dehydrogenase (short-subunit alcohol dehydrogenase family)